MAYRTLYGHDENGVRLDVIVRTKEPKIQQLQSIRNQADIDRFIRLAETVVEGHFIPQCGAKSVPILCRKI